jgi:hypothetical protein
MNPVPPNSLWIIGTSVSIQDDGYVSHLRRGADAAGFAVRNLSVGDQTSVMGYMRLLAVRGELVRGDVVVWEYSLLDTLLTELQVAAVDVHMARRMAWREALSRGARIVVVLAAPQKHARRRSACERRIARDAEQLGLPCIDTRDLSANLRIDDPAAHYRDDRHIRADSPVTVALAEAVLRQAQNASDVPSPQQLSQWSAKRITGEWIWQDATPPSDATTQSFSNSLMAIQTLSLTPGTSIRIPLARRVIAIGIASTHESGGLWCGHPRCRPASARLPDTLAYPFLLRGTGLPCLRSTTQLVCATEAAYARGDWTDYGQQLGSSPARVAVFGVLCEARSTWRTRLGLWLHAKRKQLYENVRDWRASRARPR